MSSEALQIPIEAIVGDEHFTDEIRKRAEGQREAEGEIGPAQQTITVDARGNILGDTSAIDPHILDQLRSPESQAQIAALYRQSRYAPEPPRPARYITGSSVDSTIQEILSGRPIPAPPERRDLSKRQLVPGRLGRRLLRQYMRKRTKIERSSAKGEPTDGK